MTQKRDHGGGLDAALAVWGGSRNDWLDLSTGINPTPYHIGHFPDDCWTALPDETAFGRLYDAARNFWRVPNEAAILAAPGASSIIAQIPTVLSGERVKIEGPTYNEHRAAFETFNWSITDTDTTCVVVHPNNPDGRLWKVAELTEPQRIIDESFCDVCPAESHIDLAADDGTLILKSFGKFWGLAGLRLGFVIGDPALVSLLKDRLGPWQVSGPALQIGAQALEDIAWAVEARQRLNQDANRLDRIMQQAGATLVGGTDLFRLYDTDNAKDWQTKLARHKVWSRILPYSDRWLRLGLPASDRWDQLEAAL